MRVKVKDEVNLLRVLMRVKVEDTGQLLLRVLMRVKVKDTGNLLRVLMRVKVKDDRSTYFVF